MTTTASTPATFIADRVDLLAQILQVVAPGEDHADATVRLVADLHHMAVAAGLDLPRLAKIAQDRHAVEVFEDLADDGDSWGNPCDGLKLRTGQDRQPIQRGANFRATTGGKRRGPKRRRVIKS